MRETVMTQELKQALGLKDVVLLVLGTAIGSGIFLVPSLVLTQSRHSLVLDLLVWGLAGLLTLFGALTYAELGVRQPGTGGLYLYLRSAFGPLPAFLYGWTLFFVIGNGVVAALVIASTAYIGQLLPMGPASSQGVALLLMVMLAMINIRGTQLSASFLNLLTVLKIGVVALMIIALPLLGKGLEQVQWTWPEGGWAVVLPAAGGAMISVLWAYEGWQFTSFIAGEVVAPQRTFPRGLLLGTVALLCLYGLANLAYLSALGIEGVAGSERVAADAVAAVLGPEVAAVIALVAALAMLSAANATLFTTTRVYYAMARDQAFFLQMAQVHPRFGTPAFAVTGSCLWAGLLAVSGSFSELLTHVVFMSWVFYALGALGLFVLRRRQRQEPSVFRVPGNSIPPVLFIAAAVALVLNTVLAQPRQSLLGLFAVLCGVPAFYAWRAHARRSLPAVPVGAALASEGLSALQTDEDEEK